MRRLRVLIVTGAAVALTAGLVSSEALGGGAMAGAKKVTVKLADNVFEPKKRKVRKGTLVRFKWIGKNDHNVVKKKGPGPAFASKITSKPGIQFKKKFTKRGKYVLLCTIHAPDMKMTLRVR